jgi:hypothetical protein
MREMEHLVESELIGESETFGARLPFYPSKVHMNRSALEPGPPREEAGN